MEQEDAFVLDKQCWFSLPKMQPSKGRLQESYLGYEKMILSWKL